MIKQWIVDIDDTTKARVSVDRVGDIVVFIDSNDSDGRSGHLAALAMTSLRGCQLGMALIDASKDAGALRRKLEEQAERAAARMKKTVDAAVGITPKRKAKRKR